MSVKTLKSGKGILGNIGSIATLAGTFIPGVQFLTPLGMGMSAVDSMINGSGDAETTNDALGKLKDAITGWQNPASGSISKVASKAADIAKSTIPMTSNDELFSRGWGAYR